jgi:hypothetical protein
LLRATPILIAIKQFVRPILVWNVVVVEELMTPTYPPDPVEGNKNAPQVKCPRCDGSGKGSKEEYQIAYRWHQQDYHQRLAEWKKTKTLRKSALAKLTKEEIEALGV